VFFTVLTGHSSQLLARIILNIVTFHARIVHSPVRHKVVVGVQKGLIEFFLIWFWERPSDLINPFPGNTESRNIATIHWISRMPTMTAAVNPSMVHNEPFE
jgi:hypothetical protein